MKYHDVTPSALDLESWESVSCIMQVKCRACPKCLRKRSWHWRLRAKAEFSFAPRTWFSTFTYRPEEHYRLTLEASSRARRQGIDFDSLPDREKIAALVDVGGEDITKWLKRVRKSAAGPLRYLFVSETHKSGLPHYHALIHEVTQGAATYDLLRRNWPHGFTQFKLVDPAEPKAVSYVTKYISKSLDARVRASQGYGEDTAYAKVAEATYRRRTDYVELVPGRETSEHPEGAERSEHRRGAVVFPEQVSTMADMKGPINGR